MKVLQLFRRPYPEYFSIERLYGDIRQALPPDIEVEVSINRSYSRGMLPRLLDAVRASQKKADVYHVTGDVHYLTYFLKCRRTVLTIHDCLPLTCYTGIEYWLLWFFWFWLPIHRCAAIVAVSQATKDRVLHYIRCDPKRIHVIHCNVSEEFQPHPVEFNSTCPRILHIGTWENKNLNRHIAALSNLNCKLVIVGELSGSQQNALNQHNVKYENYVGLPREALLREYHCCDILLFASTYEGFGLPIVEAQAVGRPVVTSDILSMPEVAGNAACLVNPFDVDSIRAGVLRIVNDPDYRNMLIQKGFVNVERFRLDRIAMQYASLYRSLAQSSW